LAFAFCIVLHLAHRQELICRWLCGRCVQHKSSSSSSSSTSTRSSLFTRKRQNIPAGGHTVRMRPCGARLPHEAYIRTNVNACTLCRLFYHTPDPSRPLTNCNSFFFFFSSVADTYLYLLSLALALIHNKLKQARQARRVSLVLVCSLSSHRHSYIDFIFSSRFIVS